MLTVNDLCHTLQEVFDQEAEKLAHETGFIQRKRRWSGSQFAKTMVFGWMQSPDARLSQLRQSALEQGCCVSKKSIWTRLQTPAATAFMKALLHHALQQRIQSEDPSMPLSLPFSQVVLLDSTQIRLPLEMITAWDGGGNHSSRRAAMKIQVAYDWYQGDVQMSLHPGVQSDRRLPLLDLSPDSLVVQDAGFFSVDRCLAYEAHHVNWLSRFPANYAVTVGDDQPFQSLAHFLQAQEHHLMVDEVVYLTHHRLPMRLIAQQLPDEMIHTRQAKLIADTYRRDGKAPSATRLSLCRWFVVATNVPSQRLSPHQAICLYRARWQIELLFKYWKHEAALTRSRSHNPQRIMTELYSKLLMLLVQHWFFFTSPDLTGRRSLPLMGQVLRSHVTRVVAAWGNSELLQQICDELADYWATCLVASRLQRPAFFQLLQHYFP